MDIQARIPPALAAIHNFIRQHDPDEIQQFGDDDEDDWMHGVHGDGVGILAEGPAGEVERDRANERRDRIAQEMWRDYQEVLAERGEL